MKNSRSLPEAETKRFSREQIFVLYLFNKFNAGLKVHAEVDELPLNAFLLVLLLLQYEHVVVEELLKSFVGVVDQQLLQGVQLEWNCFTSCSDAFTDIGFEQQHLECKLTSQYQKDGLFSHSVVSEHCFQQLTALVHHFVRL